MTGPIKVSRSIKELAVKVNQVQRENLIKTGEEITINQIAEILEVSKEEIAVSLEYTRPIQSINEEAYEEEGTLKIELISSGKDEANIIANKLSLKELINNLETREKEIVILRYFKDKTQMQVANILGMSQVQVSRIEKKILNNMKEKLIS